QRRRCVRTAGTCGSICGGKCNFAHAVTSERALHPFFRNDRLHDPGKYEAENETPTHFPHHAGRDNEGMPECQKHRGAFLRETSRSLVISSPIGGLTIFGEASVAGGVDPM